MSRRLRVVTPIVVGVVLAVVAMGVGQPAPVPARDVAASPGRLGSRAAGPTAPHPIATRTLEPTPLPTPPAAPALTPREPDPEPDLAYPESCRRRVDPVVSADDLLAGRFDLGPHPSVDIRADPTWGEDPLQDRNWRYRYHSLRYVLDLLDAWRQTAEVTYYRRAVFLLRDWYRDNPRAHPPSDFSWADQATGFRAAVYACAAEMLGTSGWLREALVLHGETLADPRFYTGRGNHALDQDIGLLEVGGILGRSDWMRLARDRIVALLARSVDDQGVTNEQSTGYQLYNWSRYAYARERFRALGLPLSPLFARVDRMPLMLAHATLPDGRYETLGDTDRRPARAIPGTPAEYAATGGLSGQRPTSTLGVYRAGFLFARTGWGKDRPTADEVFMSLRWGRPATLHGHEDGGSITLYGYGSRVLIDPGRYAYSGDRWQRFFASRPAHNVVTVDGVAWDPAQRTDLVALQTTTAVIDCRLAIAGLPGVDHDRRVTFSRSLGYAVVEDRLTAATARTYRQLWHLGEDARVRVDGNRVVADGPAGDLLLEQLVGHPVARLTRASREPIQGWVSPGFKQRLPATVVEAIQHGREARFVTLLLPTDGSTSTSISSFRLTPLGYRFVITVGGRSERISVTDHGASIVALAGRSVP